MCVASTKGTYNDMMLIQELGGAHGHNVDFETTSFTLRQLPKKGGQMHIVTARTRENEEKDR